ncbi:8-oxoguanine DNA glycosylase OGG fold protein [Streptomyces sp. NBC_01800]|uniref:8-oxoguanine DNA glycosylase OGG fold protein n=2 Tax=Streptomyces sp. NBC_01800 TaxID=2975945 RepID=UPI002DDA9A0D|nr:hypothetical protein [Streptomyces sp. NBC_01800]
MQDRADAIDQEMVTRLLPNAAVTTLGRWWSANAVRCADGTPGAHSIRYTPGRWAQINPWPSGMAPFSQTGDAAVSRAEVTSMVANALRRDAFREALVATYVWGKGKRGSPSGSGPSTLSKILAADGLDEALAAATTALGEIGAREAYAALHRRIPGFGPSFFTKFLYFTGRTLRPGRGPEPLILDRVLSLRLRSRAAAVGLEAGLDLDGSVAAWAWADWDWSPHRYGIYLSYMQAATRQLASTGLWPAHAGPDLLEYALFTTEWQDPS